MKKVLSLFVAIIIVFSTCLTSFAKAKEYHIKDLGITISIPDSYYVILPEMSEDDPVFEDYFFDPSQTLSYLKSNGILLDAISKNDYSEEIIILGNDSEGSDFSSQSDTLLKQYAAASEKSYNDSGINLTNYQVYQNKQTKFIIFEGESISKNIHQYFTINNKKEISINMRSSDSISSNKKEKMKNIVDAIRFDVAPMKAETFERTKAFMYQDETYGISFMAPENWRKEDDDNVDSSLRAEFKSNKENGLLIAYNAFDTFDYSNITIPSGTDRKEVDTDFFAEKQLADFAQIGESNFKKMEYNKKMFFVTESVVETEENGKTKMTWAIYIENGFMYVLLFNSTSDDEYFKDFEKLLSTVTIDEELVQKTIKQSQSVYWMELSIVLVLFIVAIVLFLLGMKLLKKQKDIEIIAYNK